MEWEDRGELFKRYEKNPILRADDWPYPANSVFNPAAALVDGDTLLMVRVEDHRGFSHMTVARSENGYDDWVIDDHPTFPADPENYPEEQYGIEDPRITYIEEQDAWAVAYTAYSESGPLTGLAMTKDFRHFDRIGATLPPENKDAALFPVRFGGRWAMLHRPVSSISNAKSNIWISFSPDMKYWGEHQVLLYAREGGWWDANKIGLSPQPIYTDEGWLIMYHGVRATTSKISYRLGMALLDLGDPRKVICRSDGWIFGPRELYERTGDVNDVVFPCGWLRQNNEIRLYYGSADTYVSVATARLSDLLDYMRTRPRY
ncbi:glycosidase [Methanolobus chelungpuianus]|uniref:Glycosidase n=1 Tax=Methanolobus chelungpuianus TaxID=502115 RepID=A0AAE3HB03_9EURY|nr:glycosidase [Methanolobus chelungpuianus]MCQ6963266.1 glycosidase [Methanolobus chelungpuianus]